MLDKFKKIIDDLQEKRNLVLRFREPAACEICCSVDVIQKYHASYKKSNRYVIEDPKKIKGLVILEDEDIISGKCPDCGALRIKQKFQLEKIYWTTCRQCMTKQLSFIMDTCPICDEDSKKAKEKFLKKHGG